MRATATETAAGTSAGPRNLGLTPPLRLKQKPRNLGEKGTAHGPAQACYSTCSTSVSTKNERSECDALPPWDLEPQPRHILFRDLSPLSRRRIPLTILNKGTRPQPVRVLNRHQGDLQIGTGLHLSPDPIICPLLAPGLSLRVNVGAPPLLGPSVEQALRVVGPGGREVEIPVEGRAPLLSFTCPSLLQFSPVPPGVQQQQHLPITNTSPYSVKVHVEIAQGASLSLKTLLKQQLLQLSFHPQQLVLEPAEVGCIAVHLKADTPGEVNLPLLLVCKRALKAPSSPRCSLVSPGGWQRKRPVGAPRPRGTACKQREAERIFAKSKGPPETQTVQWSGPPPKVEAQLQLHATCVTPRWAFTVEGSELQGIDFGAVFHGEERSLTVHANNLGALPLAMSFLVPQASLSCFAAAGPGPPKSPPTPLQLTSSRVPKELQEEALHLEPLALPPSLRSSSPRESNAALRLSNGSSSSSSTACAASESNPKSTKEAATTQRRLSTAATPRRSTRIIPTAPSCSTTQQQQQQLLLPQLQLQQLQFREQPEQAANPASSPDGTHTEARGEAAPSLAARQVFSSDSEDFDAPESFRGGGPRDTPWEALLQQFTTPSLQEAPLEAPHPPAEQPAAPPVAADCNNFQRGNQPRRGGRPSRVLHRKGVHRNANAKANAASSSSTLQPLEAPKDASKEARRSPTRTPRRQALQQQQQQQQQQETLRGQTASSSTPHLTDMQPVPRPTATAPHQKRRRSASSHRASRASVKSPAAAAAAAVPAGSADGASGTVGAVASAEGAAAPAASVAAAASASSVASWKEKPVSLWGPLALLPDRDRLDLSSPQQRSLPSTTLPVQLALCRRLSSPSVVLGAIGAPWGPKEESLGGPFCAIEVTPSALLLPPHGSAAVQLKLRSEPCELRFGFQHLENLNEVQTPMAFHLHVLVSVARLEAPLCHTNYASPKPQSPCSSSSSGCGSSSGNKNSSSCCNGSDGERLGVPVMGPLPATAEGDTPKASLNEQRSPLTARLSLSKSKGPQGLPVVARLRPETAGATSGLGGSRRSVRGGRGDSSSSNSIKQDRGTAPCVFASLLQLLRTAIVAEANAAGKANENNKKACTRSPPSFLSCSADSCSSSSCCCCPADSRCCCCCYSGVNDPQTGAGPPRTLSPQRRASSISGNGSSSSSSSACGGSVGVSDSVVVGCTRNGGGSSSQLLSLPSLHHQLLAGRFELRLPRLEISPGALNFPGCVVGEEQQQVLLLLNCSKTKQLDFHVDARHPFRCRPTKGLLLPQQQFKLHVVFTPKHLGPSTQTMKITFCNKAYKRSIRLTGMGLSNLKTTMQEATQMQLQQQKKKNQQEKHQEKQQQQQMQQ